MFNRCECIKIPVVDLQTPEKTALSAMVNKGYSTIATLHIEENGIESIMFVMSKNESHSIVHRLESPVLNAISLTIVALILSFFGVF